MAYTALAWRRADIIHLRLSSRSVKMKQVAAALTATATGRIAAAAYRMTLANVRYSLYFTAGRRCPQNCLLPWGNSDPI